MDIYALDRLNGVIDIVDTYESSIWTVQFYDVSDFQLIVPATEKNIKLLSEGRYLVRDFDMSDNGFKNVMVIHKVDLAYDADKGYVLTASGAGLKSILNQRIIWNQTNLTGSIESGIRQVITENVIDPADATRKINNFELAEAIGITDTFDVQLLGEHIDEWLTTIGQTYGIGWDVSISNGKYVFELIKGTDRTFNQTAVTPVIFSPEYDNLVSSDYSYDMGTYKNAALIGGEGEGINRRTATIGTETDINRYETFIEGGSVSSNGEIITLDTYLKMLQDYGKEELAQTQYNETFTGEIVQNGMYQLNKDYFIGDIVQANNGYINAKSRIVEVVHSVDANGETLLPTFAEWEVIN